MARNKSQPRYTAEAAQKRLDWFASADASAEGIADWDIKTQLLAEAVLGTLAMGSAIMLGVSMSGDAVSVTIYVGETKHRKWVTDSIELEDYLAVVVDRVRQARKPTNLVDISQAAD
jgi:hypothetical protein